MKLLIPVITVLLVLTGCSSLGKKPEPEIQYVEVKVPVPKTPMPPNTDCPVTELELLTPTQIQDNSELAKAYRITVAQLRDCSDLRQKVLDKYREIAKDDQEILNNVPSAAAPFGSSVVAPGPDAAREMKIDDEFSDLETEFRNLHNKDYSIK